MNTTYNPETEECSTSPFVHLPDDAPASCRKLANMYNMFISKNIQGVLDNLDDQVNWLDQTGSPNAGGHIAGRYKGKEDVVDKHGNIITRGVRTFFSRLTGGYQYDLYCPYEFSQSDDGLTVTVSCHDSGTYAKDGRRFYTESNHYWILNNKGLVVDFRAINGETINGPNDYVHRPINKITQKTPDKGLSNVKKFYQLFSDRKYDDILEANIFRKDVHFLNMGRVIVVDVQGNYQGVSGLKKIFDQYNNCFVFNDITLDRLVYSNDRNIITAVGRDNGWFVREKYDFTTEWNHVFYLDEDSQIYKCRIISAESVPSVQYNDLPVEAAQGRDVVSWDCESRSDRRSSC
ncbi:deoxyribonuclease TATDN [Acrasis kona]|uniref:Deoxyribonuclease TATDN n=1 Tax=Acrasis kona TaxID=1008807 RepID=A0AAW2YWH2_9EUKA